MRRLTAIESVLAIAVGGSILACMVPEFIRNLHASRLSEPLENLNQLASRATAIAAGRDLSRAYPETAPLTPSQVPAGVRVVDPPGTWEHTTWRRLGFAMTSPHAFSYAFESQNGPGGSRFVAWAHGDLDGDGVLSTFQLGGQIAGQAPPTIGDLEVDQEVE